MCRRTPLQFIVLPPLPPKVHCTLVPQRYTVQQNLPYAKWLGSRPSELLLSKIAEIYVKGKLQPERVMIV